MWADFLSHFSEIGLINGGAPEHTHHEVIKQRPPSEDPKASNAAEGEKKEGE